jgi:hypothetical protein
MPNWVYNGLTIEGNPDEVKKMMAQLNKPFKQLQDSWNVKTQQMEKKNVLYPEPVFAFHNIYNYMDAGISEDVYMSQPDHTLPIAEAMKFNTNDWYSFNVREWGTKWDVAVNADEKYPDTSMEDTINGENHVVHYNFNTAWSPPFPAIAKLSAQYPTLLFTHSYEEETGWGGECEFLRGEKISESEYGWMCRECEHTEDETPYCEECEFDMCPNCGYGEPMDEDRAKCQTHALELTPSHKKEA